MFECQIKCQYHVLWCGCWVNKRTQQNQFICGTYTAFKIVRSARCFVFKEVSFAHQGCILFDQKCKILVYIYVCICFSFCDAKLNFLSAFVALSFRNHSDLLSMLETVV